MKAFTLVEMLAYLSILSTLLLASASFAYGVGAMGGKDEEIMRSVEDASFALRKVAWAWSQSDAVRVQDREVHFLGNDPVTLRFNEALGTLEMRSGDAFEPIAMRVRDASFEVGDALTVRFVLDGPEFGTRLSL